MPKKNNRNKKAKKIHPAFLYAALVIIAIWLILGFFLFKPEESDTIFLSSANPKQGDTVVVIVQTQSENVAGFFGNEKLVFYKKQNAPEWISFLGIDADQPAGDYTVAVSTSASESLSQKIHVNLAYFSGVPAVEAPKNNKNGITNQQAINNIRSNDNPALNAFFANITPQPYFTAPFSFPLQSITKDGYSFGEFIGFGADKIQHLGVDLKAPEKTPIYAVNAGKVVATLHLSNYGNTLVIDHGLGIFSLYLHLSSFKVKVGQMVSLGQEVALSGDTGYVTGPHLHFSMRVNGSRVDPLEFIADTKQINDTPNTANVSSGFLSILK